MKKLIIGLFLCLSLIFVPFLVHAAGTVTVTTLNYGQGYWRVRYAWTADASDGSVPATASGAILGYVILAVTDPGATSPTDGYAVTITDDNSVDVFGGELGDLDEANTEQWVPKIDSVYGPRFVSGTLTLNLSGNVVNSATGTLDLYIVR